MTAITAKWMPSLRRPGRVLAVTAAAVLLNLISLELPGGPRVLLGGLPAMLCLLLLPGPWGLLATAIAFAPTVLTFGHPFALMLATTEGIWLVLTVRRRRWNPMVADVLFWILVGAPLGWYLYRSIGRLPTELVLLTLLKQGVTQLVFVTVAVVFLQLWPAFRPTPGTGRVLGLRELVFKYMFVLTAVPLVLAGLGFSVMSRRIAEAEERALMLDATHDATRQVEQFLELHQATLVSAARFIERHPDQAGSLIEEIRRTHPALITLLVADATGGIVETAPGDVRAQLRGSSVADRAYFWVARERGEPYVSGVFRGRGFGSDLLVALSVPLQDETGRFAGIVQASLEIQRFGRSALVTGAAGTEMILADQGGRVIYADPATGLRTLEHLQHTTLRPFLSRRPEELLTHDLVIDGRTQRRVRSYGARCGKFGLLVVAQRPVLAPLNEVQHGYGLIGVIVAGVLGGAILVAMVARRRLATPLEHFARDAEGQAARGVVAEIASPEIALPREVALVFAAFNRLAARLQATHAELRRNNAELDRRVAERTAEAEQARQIAEAASRSKTDFLTMTSHEIRTPLNAIIGLAEGSDSAAVDPALAARLELIRHAGERLLGVVNDLLDLSRVEAGKLELALAPVEIAALSREVTGLLSTLARRQAVALRWDTGAEVPAWVKTDGARLHQVIVNLVGNGLKFARQGSVQVRVDAVSRRAGRVRLRFAVIDTGPGIAPEEQSRLFQPFAQLRGAAEGAMPGSGLGLVISRRLVELLGGTLQLHSEVGRGTEFAFEIEVEPAEPPRVESAPVSAGAMPTVPRWEVLVADDNVANQEVLRLILEPRCRRIEVVGSGQAALLALQRDGFDAALIDLDMPDLDGLRVARTWRQDPRAAHSRCRLVAVSAHRRRERWADCAAAGFDAYVEKPINRTELLRELGGRGAPAS